MSAKSRENVWKRVCELAWSETKAVLVYSTNTEQGFRVETLHDTWQPIDYDGLQLMLKPNAPDIELHSVSEEYVVFDLETTGLDPKSDQIIEIGALLVRDGVITKEKDWIIKERIPSDIEELTGITQKMADQGSPIENALKELASLFAGRDVIGYNNRSFDIPFILTACRDHHIDFPLRKVIDVLPLVRKKVKGVTSYRMHDIAALLYLPDYGRAHRALTDAKICKALYDYCRGTYR